jgi:hypothetical protein
VLADFNFLAEESEPLITPIMVAGEYVCPLTNAAVRTNGNEAMIVNPNAFANPNVIAYFEEPWILDGNAWLTYEPPTHLGAEAAKDPRLHPGRDQPQERALKNQGISDIPYPPADRPAVSVYARVLELV